MYTEFNASECHSNEHRDDGYPMCVVRAYMAQYKDDGLSAAEWFFGRLADVPDENLPVRQPGIGECDEWYLMDGGE